MIRESDMKRLEVAHYICHEVARWQVLCIVVGLMQYLMVYMITRGMKHGLK